MAASSSLANFSKRLQGKVALITGGASGIGESTARLFSRNGAKVVIADVQTDLGHSVSKEISSESGEKVSFIHCNVAKESDVENAVNNAVSLYGKLDVIYNNAGIRGNTSPNILAIESEDFKKVLDVNLYGAFLGAKHAARVMIPRKKGCILFTSSIASVTNGGLSQAYTASKHAVVGLTKNLAVELGKYGIRVNSISPAGVPTPGAAGVMGVEAKKVQEIFYSIANLKEAMLDGNDIAHAAMYLASDDAQYVSGTNLVVDGGFSLTNNLASVARK
ncbi:short chain aldehyde dehydrogenase 1-like [Mercurialis annua]|uniref:short chain aldehyde dehydrogenase 1-like n=1 Tax=Mercurialis annua TaxID=3986 RepID=UPI00215E312E|nr:short chain aldehyde dehydrogenase 1-like [Mercurialis annua]